MRPKVWAVYKGDELLAVGTKEEVCGQLGITSKTLYWLASPANIKHDKGGRRRIAYRYDEE